MFVGGDKDDPGTLQHLLHLSEGVDPGVGAILEPADSVGGKAGPVGEIPHPPSKRRPGHANLHTRDHRPPQKSLDGSGLNWYNVQSIWYNIPYRPFSAMVRPQNLPLEIHLYTYLRQKLLEAFPDADDDTIRDTLEGITTLHELIAEIIRSALVDEALQSGLRLRLEDMKERLSRLETRSSKKRELAGDAMQDAGIRKLEQPDFTASARAGSPSLVVTAEEQIPEAYWVPQPPRLDRQALLGGLKRGEEIHGVHLSNSKPVLSVRTK